MDGGELLFLINEKCNQEVYERGKRLRTVALDDFV